ncbi:hypothetical protein OHS81_07720 [Streptomyces sp. NBC_00400]|uniref:hypothetical protein n=1 Tax=Streptomyces sp. NBC_00400 TaxID=2975737 RepID=UPI002E1E1728
MEPTAQAGELTEQECREVDEALVRGEDRRGSRTSGPRRVSGPVPVPVYDSGMLIAPADRKAKAAALHEGLRTSAHRTLVLGPVLTQVWRADPALVHAVAGASKV